MMGMELLRSNSPTLAAKGIWVHLLACNIIRRMMLQAPGINGVLPPQRSVKHALPLCMRYRHYLIQRESDDA